MPSPKIVSAPRGEGAAPEPAGPARSLSRHSADLTRIPLPGRLRQEEHGATPEPGPTHPGLAEVLCDASKHFELRVLEKTIDGEKQSLVLAGESHLGTDESRERARALMRSFDAFLVEGDGQDMNRRWSCRAMRPLTLGYLAWDNLINQINIAHSKERLFFALDRDHLVGLDIRQSLFKYYFWGTLIGALWMPVIAQLNLSVGNVGTAAIAAALALIGGGGGLAQACVHSYREYRKAPAWRDPLWKGLLLEGLWFSIFAERNLSFAGQINGSFTYMKGGVHWPLAVMGKRHIPAVVEILKQDAGWKEVTLDMYVAARRRAGAGGIYGTRIRTA